ncbi:hypothetical protein AGLY_012928 [Aphis glycines]|uniref:Uncharacterized protein n=1 Tax=Aphis glycines TaxID=307491 RepID=A0A6G0T7E7_APHGL|nr:hypothetical protein AGLY_012928 [Aphis glycines]
MFILHCIWFLHVCADLKNIKLYQCQFKGKINSTVVYNYTPKQNVITAIKEVVNISKLNKILKYNIIWPCHKTLVSLILLKLLILKNNQWNWVHDWANIPLIIYVKRKNVIYEATRLHLMIQLVLWREGYAQRYNYLLSYIFSIKSGSPLHHWEFILNIHMRNNHGHNKEMIE